MTAPFKGEPGSPSLAVAGVEGVQTFRDADTLAVRLHTLREGAGLDCTVGHVASGDRTQFPAVMVWIAEPRRFLALTMGPGVRTPSDLLAALRRTAQRRAA